MVVMLLGYIFVTTSTYFKSQEPIVQGENMVVDKAKGQVDLQSIEDFHLYTKDKTFYSIEATNSEGRPIYFSYEPESDFTKLGYADEMVNEEDALALTRNELPDVEVQEARLGIENEIFIWEVSYFSEDGTLGYHYINAVTGQWYETINNL